jgi:SNF2 family DNA or RNA helicase
VDDANNPEEVCPLITPYTRKIGIPDATLEKLFKVRNWRIPEDGEIPFKYPTALRRTIWSPLRNEDTGVPLVPKQFQIQMSHNLSRMPRFINGEAVGCGKSIEAIIAACWLRDRIPTLKVIVVTTKTVMHQFAGEFERFSHLKPMVMEDKYKGKKSYEARYPQMQEFLDGNGKDVLVCKYSSMIGKRRKVEGRYDEDGMPTFNGKERIAHEVKEFLKIIKPHGPNILLILDESHRYKTPGASTRTMVEILARPCGRVWALTATAMRNSLDEFYSVAHAIGIRPCGSLGEFEDEFCIFKEIYIGKGRKKRVLEGYRNVAKFKAGMRPFFLGRSQRQLKEKLPRLQTIIHPIDLDAEQTKLLLEDIPSGKYQLPPTVLKVAGEIVTKERDPKNEWTLLSIYQLVANHQCLLDPGDLKAFHTHSLSPKEEHLLDLLDGDLKGEPVVVYSKSRSHITRLEYLTKEGKFTERKFLRITGAEDEKQRYRAIQLFQEPDNGYDVIFINSAAAEGCNLQIAGHLICLDLPFALGDLLQVVGRILRIGSRSDMCILHILCARGSVDEFAIETLKSKKGVFEQILGESHTAGLLDDKEVFDIESGMEQTLSDAEFLNMMKAHVKSVKLGSFLRGVELAHAQGIELPSREGETQKVKADPMASIEDHMEKWGL